MRVGVCRECLVNVELNDKNKLRNHEVWECPKCGYPNCEADFGRFGTMKFPIEQFVKDYNECHEEGCCNYREDNVNIVVITVIKGNETESYKYIGDDIGWYIHSITYGSLDAKRS